ncbi:hypothetical protein R84B8_02931 [Treponema sp. R8-4-B8]
MKRVTLFVLIASLFVYCIGAQGITRIEQTVSYSIRDTADYRGNRYISYWGQHPHVLTFVNGDGSVTVCASDMSTINSDLDGMSIISNEPTTYIYEYDSNLKEQKILTVKNEFNNLGAFTKDNDGNYYFFFADSSTDRNKENMAMVKYNRDGEKINTYKLKAFAPNSFDGIKKPFDSGTCRLELSGTMLAVYFARLMYSGHQASYGFILDKNTFERIDKGAATNADKDGGYLQMPYVSHSFNQFILPIDNGFVFADHGDAYTRSFTFAKFLNESRTKRVHAFGFPGKIGANQTYAEMGGLAKTSDGYIFAGTYGKERENPRDIFVLTFDENMSSCSAPIYLTKYTKNDGHAGHPKIVKIDSNRYLLLWEFFKFSTQAANIIASGKTEYLTTYMLLIDEKGKAISEPQELNGIRLSMNDTLRYNPHNGKVYWAINEGEKLIVVYALESPVK